MSIVIPVPDLTTGKCVDAAVKKLQQYVAVLAQLATLQTRTPAERAGVEAAFLAQLDAVAEVVDCERKRFSQRFGDLIHARVLREAREATGAPWFRRTPADVESLRWEAD